MAHTDDFAAVMQMVATELLGQPNGALSSPNELRYGTHGSLAVSIPKGTWYDHEANIGGGVLDLIARETGRHPNGAAGGAVDWLRERGYITQGINGAAAKARAAAERPFKVAGRWNYVDENGKILFRVVREENGEVGADGKAVKRYRQRATGDGGRSWSPRVKGVRQVPYRVPELIENLAADRVVFIAEGEKKVDALYGIGVPATCNAMGAGKWPGSLTPFFAGADVLILPDNDEPGRKHADLVAKALAGTVRQVRTLQIPGLPKKGDVADWISAGGTAEMLYQMAENLSVDPAVADGSPTSNNAGSAPAPSAVVVLDPQDPIGIARQFLASVFTDSAGRRMMHHHKDQFLRFVSGCYAGADENDVRAGIWTFLEAAFRRSPKGELVAFHPRSRDVSNVLDALAAACNLDAGITPPAWLSNKNGQPSATEFIAVQNGLLHLPTGKLSAATPDFFTLSGSDVTYDPRAPQPKRWLNFLTDLFGDDHQSIGLLQEWFGHSISTDTNQQKILLVVGPKRSGKGTIARVLSAMLRNSVVSPTLASLSSNFGLEPLIGRQLAVIADARLGHRSDQAAIAERLLSISGEDSMTIDRKFRSAWHGRLSVRFMLLTNELPRLADSSGALASRFLVMVLTNSFYGREDHGLEQRLLAELPGIFNWAREGYDRLRKRGFFEQPDTGREAIEELEALASPTIAFVRDKCRVSAGLEIEVPVLYTAWRAWNEANGRKEPGDVQAFGRNLRAAFPGIEARQKRAAGERLRVYGGIDLQR